MTHPPNVRRGMTLIELLVVVAILMLLVITVAPNVVNTAEARRGREATRMVSGMVAKAQSRAVGRSEWSGLMLAAAGGGSFAAIDLYLADVPAPYRGDTVDATITMAAMGDPARNGTPSPGGLASMVAVGVAEFDQIRFGGRGPLYEIASASPTMVTIRMLGFQDSNLSPDDLGYTNINTPWPPPVPLPFEIHRRPAPAGSPMSIPGNRVVDLRWSGVGPPQVDGVVGTYREFGRSGPVSAVSAVFDGTGRLRQVVVGADRVVVTGPVFLLVGRPERAGQPFAPLDPADETLGANWQYPDSWWVAIDPMTGVAKSAECVPGASTVIQSQAWIRDALLGTAR